MALRSSLLPFAAACLALAGVIAACGGDDDPGGGPTPASDAGTSDAVDPGTGDSSSGDTSAPLPSGALDPTFGTAGLATFRSPLPSTEVATAVLRQADGKILVVGAQQQTSSAFVARFTASGALDPTFGNGGRLVLEGGLAYSAALQADGKILVGRFTSVARLNADGSIDTTFGTSGRASIDDMTPNAITALADGTIVVAGVRPNVSIGFTVARLTSAGALDTTFDGDGYAENTAFAGSRAHSIAIDAAGRIVVAGEVFGTTTLPVARFLSTGALDGAFGTNGQVAITMPQTVGHSAIAIQADGKLVVAGKSGSNCATTRLAADTGAIDTSFAAMGDAGATGIVLGPVCGTFGPVGLAIRPGGAIVVSKADGLFQLAADGTLDAAFGTSGVSSLNGGTPKLPASGFQAATLLAPDGTILGAGSVNGLNGESPSVWRVTSGGVVDTTFGTAGQTTFPFHLVLDEARRLDVLADDSMIVAGKSRKGVSAVKVTASGAVDTTFGEGGFADLAIGGVGGVGRDASGRVFVAGELQVYALTPQGKPDATFGTSGTRTVASPVASNWFLVDAMVVDPTGRPVVAGRSGGQGPTYLTVARVTAAGVQDDTYGTKGTSNAYGFTLADASMNAIAMQPDGKLLVSGYASSSSFVMRLDGSGVLDPSFGGGTGKVTFDNLSPSSIAVQADGKILLASGGAIARLDASGVLDATFGTAGIARVPDGAGVAADVVRVRADGKIFGAGNAGANGKTSMGIVRFSSSGVFESVTAPAFPLETAAYDLAFQTSGAPIVSGYALDPLTYRDFAIARFVP